MSFARSMSNKFGKKLVDTAKKSATDAVKASSIRAIQKTVEATGQDQDAELTTPRKKYISPEERQKIIDELRLVPKYY